MSSGSGEAELTVLMPVHNGLPYLPAALDSVLRQTYEKFEVIVLDDGSTDGTSEYLASVTDARVRVVRLERVRLVAAMNHGLSLVRTPLVAQMHADDICHPRRFEEQVALFRAEPSLAVASCQFERIDSEGRVLERVYDCETDAAARWYLLFSPAFVSPGTMYRRDLAESVGGYLPGFDVTEDYSLWTRLAACGRLGICKDVLLQYRSHGESASAKRRDQMLRESTQISAEYASQVIPGVERSVWSELRWFMVTGEQPSRHSMGELVKAFKQAVRKFAPLAVENSDLAFYIQKWQRHLRTRMVAAAESEGWGGKRLRFLWLALKVDPECRPWRRFTMSPSRLNGL